MPFKQGNSLTDDDAFDVAAYFSQKDRPDFLKKAFGWPKGKRPKDARY
jgi:thiosulfate dehydrogenase